MQSCWNSAGISFAFNMSILDKAAVIVTPSCRLLPCRLSPCRHVARAANAIDAASFETQKIDGFTDIRVRFVHRIGLSMVVILTCSDPPLLTGLVHILWQLPIWQSCHSVAACRNNLQSQLQSRAIGAPFRERCAVA